VPGTLALYARVSTSGQDASRQLEELRDAAAEEYPDHTVAEYVDVVSGAAREGREEYDRLREDIRDGGVDVVLVDEISRLSRLGGGEIHRFIQLCAEHETSLRDREVGLSLDVTDSAVDQAVTKMLAGLMGSLAEIEHRQKLRRIRSGIEAAQEAGKWTGRPPRGFNVDDGFLRVDPEPFLRVRAALERVAAGEAVTTVAEDTGLPTSTLARLYDERAELYLRGEADDERVDAAVEPVRPLPDPEADPDEWRDEVREIVRDELETVE